MSPIPVNESSFDLFAFRYEALKLSGIFILVAYLLNLFGTVNTTSLDSTTHGPASSRKLPVSVNCSPGIFSLSKFIYAKLLNLLILSTFLYLYIFSHLAASCFLSSWFTAVLTRLIKDLPANFFRKEVISNKIALKIVSIFIPFRITGLFHELRGSVP